VLPTDAQRGSPSTPTTATSTSDVFLALQRSAGNAAVGSWVGPRGTPRDDEDVFEAAVRNEVECATGFDLSAADISHRSQVADRLGVEALTIGHHIHLGSRVADAGTPHGDHVLAHELAHVVQQSSSESADGFTRPGRADRLEHDAEQIADRSRRATGAEPEIGAGDLQQLPTATTGIAQAYDPRYHRRSLVHGLQDTGFSDEDVGRIYAANWERDMSQAHPALAQAALRWKEVKMAAVNGERPLEPRIEAFDASVDYLLKPEVLLYIKSSEAYGGYRYFEHMDNPGAEPELDPQTAEDEAERQRRVDARALLDADAGGIPRYMADSRDYTKAQLVLAAQTHRAMEFGEGSAAGQVRDAWQRREEELKDLVPHNPDVEIRKVGGFAGIGGHDPGTAVIVQETAHQSAELGAAGPGASYDGERVTPAVPPPEPAPGPAPEAEPPDGAPPAPEPVEFERLPLAGPAFNAEVDRRYWAQFPDRNGQRLDPANPDDQPFIAEWLRIRDQVRLERKETNDARASAAAAETARRAEEARQAAAAEVDRKAREAAGSDAGGRPAGDGPDPGAATPTGPAISPETADHLGRASHALQDFWSHSNFVERCLGIKLQEINPGVELPGGSPSDVDTKLQTSTFSSNDSMHSLAHKVRAVADEIESETALVNRVAGRTTADPDPSEVDVGSEAPVHETAEQPLRLDDARSDPTMQEIEEGVVGSAKRGALRGGLIGAGAGMVFGLPGAFAGAVGGALLGGLFGAQEGVKDEARQVIATPRGVSLLRRLAEGLEEETREGQEKGSHTQIAKDQPGHDAHDPMNALRTLRFEVSQECSVRADREVIGAMRKVLDAPPDRVEAELQQILELMDKLIGAPKGHPYLSMVEAHKERATEMVADLMAARTG
jgi:Domain of unknown function (DUF4157)